MTDQDQMPKVREVAQPLLRLLPSPIDEGEQYMFTVACAVLIQTPGFTGEQLYLAFYGTAMHVVGHLHEVAVYRLEKFPAWAAALTSDFAVLGEAVHLWAVDRGICQPVSEPTS